VIFRCFGESGDQFVIVQQGVGLFCLLCQMEDKLAYERIPEIPGMNNWSISGMN
jgi:hypothetical protein